MRRFLILGVEDPDMGIYQPDWYETIRLSREWRIPPWRVCEAPLYWRDRTMDALNAEAEAQRELDRRNRGG